MPLEKYLENAIQKVVNGTANEDERILVLANEAIGILKNGGFIYFYNYDFSNLTHAEVIAAHSEINPSVYLLYQGFQGFLSDYFFPMKDLRN
jgi:hypothetical protein